MLSNPIPCTTSIGATCMLSEHAHDCTLVQSSVAVLFAGFFKVGDCTALCKHIPGCSMHMLYLDMYYGEQEFGTH